MIPQCKSMMALAGIGLAMAFSNPASACDRAHLSVSSVTQLPNGHYTISVTMCAGAGTSEGTFGADQNTGDFAYIVEGATIVDYPATITSPQTGAAYQAVPHGSDTMLYTHPTMWWACINSQAECGPVQTVCATVTFTFSALPTKIRLLGMEGGGNPEVACAGPAMEVLPASCGTFSVSAGNDVTLKGNVRCADLSATVTGGTAATYAWSTGATTQTINECPTATTVYTVTVTDRNGCRSVDDVTVIKSGGGGKPKGGGTGKGAVPGKGKYK